MVVEALLWRGLVDLTRHLGSVEQRLGALGALLVFVSALLLLDLVNALGLWRLGRRLEARLRIAFLAKIPRLGDRYFQSRPTSDMAERSHSVHRLRLLPDLGGQLIHVAAELVVTTAGLVWLDPSHALLAVLAAVGTQVLPLAMQPLLTERDLRVRTHAGALGRFSLDALLGLTAVRTHGAERAMQREYESLLVEWTRAGLHLQRAVVGVEGVQGLLGFGLAAGLLAAYLARGGEASGALLLTYWALRLPALGQELMLLARQYPGHRNITLRLLEPLGAREEGDAGSPRGRLGARLCPAQRFRPGGRHCPGGGECAGGRAHHPHGSQPHAGAWEPCGDCGAFGGWQVESGGAAPGMAPACHRAGAGRGTPPRRPASGLGAPDHRLGGSGHPALESFLARQSLLWGGRRSRLTGSPWRWRRRICGACSTASPTACRRPWGRAGGWCRVVKASACALDAPWHGVACGWSFWTSRFVVWIASSGAPCCSARARCGARRRCCALRTTWGPRRRLIACWWWRRGGLSRTAPRPAWRRVRRRATGPC